MLGFHPISAAPISALTGPAIVIPPPARRKYAHHAQPLHPSLLEGCVRTGHNFHTGLTHTDKFLKSRSYHQAQFPLPILRGHSQRRRVDVHFTFLQPHAPKHQVHHRVWFPLDLLRGWAERHRVPGSGLTACPVQRRSRVYHQAFYPVSLLKGGHRRSFPQTHLEIVVELECPDRRHFADMLSGFYGTTETIDILSLDADEGFAFSGVADEIDVEVGIEDDSDYFAGDADEADVFVGVADEADAFSGAADAGDIVIGVGDVLPAYAGVADSSADVAVGIADEADSFPGSVDQCR